MNNKITTKNSNELFDIATGRSRKELYWKNKQMSWPDLIEKFRNTHQTHETYEEYIASKKQRQDEIKDIGGFVGGYLQGGHRRISSVLHRQLITLDLDFANTTFWDDLQRVSRYSDNAACAYSTHKHSPDKPRIRLIMPLSRPVNRDEYEAVARRIAGDLGIEQFDPTTFQAERLMYWPSTSSDGEYLFFEQEGLWINPDEILARYNNWADSSEWPVSEKVDAVIKRNMVKQGDPLEKPGVIGAFCRTYNIEQAIEKFLSEVYEPCDIENRYTFVNGSTAGGLIVYDDKFAYSHHGTDPCSGKLCNAFDLVRIHKFGLKDEDVFINTPGNKLPSYVAMSDFAIKDKGIKNLLGKERLQGAVDEFSEFIESDQELDTKWFSELAIDAKGNYLSTIANVSAILENDPLLKNGFATDEFLKKKMILKNVPWRKYNYENRFLKDEDQQNLVKYLEKVYGISNRANIKDAFDTHIDANNFHPIKDYLKSISVSWDGENRVDTLFIDYLGAADSEFTRAVTRKALCACIARIFQPGIKFDYVLTLIGNEGLGKSSLIGKLGKEWFSDSFNFNMLHSKEAYEQIQGVWIVEIGELVGLRKVEVEAAKQFISKREDEYRPAYGRNKITSKRQCVFFASTNDSDFLKGNTGNRRYWPVEIHICKPSKNVFKDLTDYEIDQIWAEAIKFYNSKEPLFLSKELEDFAKRVQKDHSESDGRIGLVQKYLNTLLPLDWESLTIYEKRAYLNDESRIEEEGEFLRQRVCAAEIWCEALGGKEHELSRIKTQEMFSIMSQIEEWKKHTSTMRFGPFGIQKGYVRIKSKSVNYLPEKNRIVNHL